MEIFSDQSKIGQKTPIKGKFDDLKPILGKEYRIKGSVTYFQTTPRFRDYYRQPQPIRCSALHSTHPIRL